MSAMDSTSGTAGPAPANPVDSVAASQPAGLVTACGLAALLTAVLVVCLVLQLQLRGVWQLPWTLVVRFWRTYLPPIAWAVPPLAAGALCLRRRRVSRFAAAAVFGSCAPLLGMAVQEPATGLRGAVIPISVLLAVAAGAATLAAAILIGRFARRSRRGLVLWCAVAAAFTAVSIPSPVSGGGPLQPFPIQTVFTGDTHEQAVTAVIGLLFAAVPLIAAGLVSARAAAAIMAGWLPVVAGNLLSYLAYQFLPFRVDFWFYVGCLAWLAVAGLALFQARSGWPRERAAAATP
jgi:hypothetical protein